MELAECPTCHGRVTSLEKEKKALRDFAAFLKHLQSMPKYGKVWKEVSCSEEGMWIKLGKTVLASLPEEDRPLFIRYLEGNKGVADIYTQRPDEALELWYKRKEKRGKKPDPQMEVPVL